MRRRANSFLTICLAAAMLVAGCGEGSTSTTTDAGAITTTAAPPPTSATPVTTTAGPEAAPSTTRLDAVPDDVTVPPQLEGLPLAIITVDDEPLLVAIAATGADRRRGLMDVEDLRDLDGMLFVWNADTNGSFWMRDTIIPLDIAFFTAEGALVNTFPMEPCDLGSECPTYPAGGTYRYALETAQGRLGTLTTSSTLTPPTE